MTTQALAHAPAHLAAKGRHELIKHVMNIRNGMAKHKQAAKHGLMTVACGALAGVGGGVAGVAAVKLPHLPKTKIRTDLTIGSLVGAAVAFGLFDEHAALAGAFSHGMLGYGTGDVVKAKLLASGVKQAA